MSIHIINRPPITQQELARLTGLLNQRDAISRQIRAMAGDLFKRLETGSPVEPGTLDAAIAERREDGRLTRLLTLNGKPVDTGR